MPVQYLIVARHGQHDEEGITTDGIVSIQKLARRLPQEVTCVPMRILASSVVWGVLSASELAKALFKNSEQYEIDERLMPSGDPSVAQAFVREECLATCGSLIVVTDQDSTSGLPSEWLKRFGDLRPPDPNRDTVEIFPRLDYGQAYILDFRRITWERV